jgi:hypothetical protein
MDVLASLNVEELPEQQTRMMHLMNEYPDFQFKLGFDACCTCGKSFHSLDTLLCTSCKRVKYCSEDCRQQDATPNASNILTEDEEGDTETAMGHTSIICTVLQTCNDDEDVEEGTDSEMNSINRQSALDRIRSEHESYPASLANISCEGPCFQDILKTCSLRKKIVFHIIGASEDAELAHVNRDGHDRKSRFHDYAEALANLTSAQKHIHTVELVFIGPECPECNIDVTTPIPSTEKQEHGKMLMVRTVKGIYSEEIIEESSINKPDIVVFFNPGFTVPEYENWGKTISSIKRGTPFILTTNTGETLLTHTISN